MKTYVRLWKYLAKALSRTRNVLKFVEEIKEFYVQWFLFKIVSFTR
jgi:hypothetical protein